MAKIALVSGEEHAAMEPAMSSRDDDFDNAESNAAMENKADEESDDKRGAAS
jgi:hypothetical protein